MDNDKTITFGHVTKKIWAHRMRFLCVWVITFALSCLWILPQPRFYTAEVLLAPESNESDAMSGLSSLASSYGFNIGGMSGSDAIYPELYPDLISSNDFIVSLFDIPVTSLDGEINANLYDYETKYQKSAFYDEALYKVKKSIKDLFKEESKGNGDGRINPFMLTKDQTDVVNKMKQEITCKVDKLTSVFVIRVKAQDPLIAATLADSVRNRLQLAIIKYRTSKANIDKEYYGKLVQEAKQEYDSIRALYVQYCDTHWDTSLRSFQAKQEDLENAMQIKYNIYTTMTASYQNALAKLQERTPAFTIIQNSTVPVKPAGPKRMLFVAFMLIVSTIATALYILKDDLKKTLAFMSNIRRA